MAGEATPADLDDAVYVYDPLGTMGQYIVDFTLDNRFQGVSFTAATIDGTDLADRPEITYDQMGGTVLFDNTPGIGGTVTLSFDGANYQIDIAPFTGKLTVVEL